MNGSNRRAVILRKRNTSRRRFIRFRQRQARTTDSESCKTLRTPHTHRRRHGSRNSGRKRRHTALACKTSISALSLSCSCSYAALSGLLEPCSMSVISEAGVVVVVVAIVSVEAGARGALSVVGLGFLPCESLVEAVLVLVGAAMDDEIKEEDTGTENRYTPGLYTFAFATWNFKKCQDMITRDLPQNETTNTELHSCDEYRQQNDIKRMRRSMQDPEANPPLQGCFWRAHLAARTKFVNDSSVSFHPRVLRPQSGLMNKSESERNLSISLRRTWISSCEGTRGEWIS